MFRISAAATVFLALVHLSCSSTLGTFSCERDGDCGSAAGGDGRCELNGTCSFVDLNCLSGRRFGSGSGQDTGTCTQILEDARNPIDAIVSDSTDAHPIDAANSSDANCGNCIPGLLVHWRFDEANNTTAFDASGGGRDGVILGVDYVSSPHGLALEFDGSGSARRDFEPDLATPNISVSAWVWVELSPVFETREVVSFGDLYGLRVEDSGEVSFFARTMGTWETLTSPMRVDNEQWHHLLGQVVGTNIELFIDGTRVIASDLGGVLTYDLPSRDFVVGHHSSGITISNMIGMIDEIRVFDRGLSDAEVMELFAN